MFLHSSQIITLLLIQNEGLSTNEEIYECEKHRETLERNRENNCIQSYKLQLVAVIVTRIAEVTYEEAKF